MRESSRTSRRLNSSSESAAAAAAEASASPTARRSLTARQPCPCSAYALAARAPTSGARPSRETSASRDGVGQLDATATVDIERDPGFDGELDHSGHLCRAFCDRHREVGEMSQLDGRTANVGRKHAERPVEQGRQERRCRLQPIELLVGVARPRQSLQGELHGDRPTFGEPVEADGGVVTERHPDSAHRGPGLVWRERQLRRAEPDERRPVGQPCQRPRNRPADEEERAAVRQLGGQAVEQPSCAADGVADLVEDEQQPDTARQQVDQPGDRLCGVAAEPRAWAASDSPACRTPRSCARRAPPGGRLLARGARASNRCRGRVRTRSRGSSCRTRRPRRLRQWTTPELVDEPRAWEMVSWKREKRRSQSRDPGSRLGWSADAATESSRRAGAVKPGREERGRLSLPGRCPGAGRAAPAPPRSPTTSP